MGNCCAKPRDASAEVYDRGTLIQGLQELAEFLETKNTNVTAVVVGGAVCTIHLRSRATTHDVDYCTDIPLDDPRRLILRQGILAVAKRNRLLNLHWMNDDTSVFLEQVHIDEMVQESIAQGVVVFSEGRLTLYAAPWEYAFINKLDKLKARMRAPEAYDMTDAIDNLRQYFTREGVTSVPRSRVKQWSDRFELALEDASYEHFNREYSQRFPDAATPIDMGD